MVRLTPSVLGGRAGEGGRPLSSFRTQAGKFLFFLEAILSTGPE